MRVSDLLLYRLFLRLIPDICWHGRLGYTLLEALLIFRLIWFELVGEPESLCFEFFVHLLVVLLPSNWFLLRGLSLVRDASLLDVLALACDGVLVVSGASLLDGADIGALGTSDLLFIPRPLLVHIGYTFTRCLLADSRFAVFARTTVLAVLLTSVLELNFIDFLLFLGEDIEFRVSDSFTICPRIALLGSLPELSFRCVS